MRSLPGPLGVVTGLVGLFLFLRSVATTSGSSLVVVAALGLIAIALALLWLDESRPSRRP